MLNVLEDLISLARQRKEKPIDDSYTNTTKWYDHIHENNPYAFKKKKAKKYM